MKSFIVLVLVLATVGLSTQQKWTEEQQKRIQQNRVDCIKETKVDPVHIDRADIGDFTDDKKLQCFAKCFYQKAGFVNDQGEVLIDVVKAKIPEADKSKAIEIIEKCKQQKGADACETTYLVHKCYFLNTHVRPVQQPEESSSPVTEAKKPEAPTSPKTAAKA